MRPVLATVEFEAPFAVMRSSVLLKRTDRKVSDTNPVVRVEAVRAYPQPAWGNAAALVNGLGFFDRDQDGLIEHVTTSTAMWVAPVDAKPVLEFELPEPVRLSCIELWNYNQEWATTNGVGSLDVAVSLDGTNWTAIAQNVRLQPAEGSPDYDTPNLLPLGGVQCRYLRFENLRPLGQSHVCGLSEVVFRTLPDGRAHPVRPTDGSTGVDPGTVQLLWTPVKNAVAYRVYLGTNQAALRPVLTTNVAEATLSGLVPGTTYFWRVDALPERGRMIRGRLAKFETAGLVAHWPMAGGETNHVLDLSGFEHHARVHGNARWVESGVGSGSALEFDGRTVYVEAPAAPVFDFAAGFTVMFWVKPSRYMAPDQLIIGHRSGGWRICRFRTDGRVALYLEGVKFRTGHPEFLLSRSVLDDGQWHHVVARYNGRYAELVIDGQVHDRVECAGRIVVDGAPLLIGTAAPESPFKFAGAISDVRIYNYGVSAENLGLGVAPRP